MSRGLIAFAAPVFVAAALVAGCGGGDEEATVTGNEADAAFIADMIPHHEGAVEMAEMAQNQAESPELQAMADDIIAAQEAEIAKMESIAEGLPEPDGGSMDMDMGMGGEHSDHSGHMSMDKSEMGMDMDPAELADADNFDLAFVNMMIPHHEGAIEMAQDLLAEGENAELQAMAYSIIDSQSAEIKQMKTWQKEWSSGS
jgi:uncharacterized protein (DUF305 family)